MAVCVFNEPMCEINVDEVVTLGAAFQSALIAADRDVDDIVMTDVRPFTLETRSTDQIRHSKDGPAWHNYPVTGQPFDRHHGVQRSSNRRLFVPRHTLDETMSSSVLAASDTNEAGIRASESLQFCGARFRSGP